MAKKQFLAIAGLVAIQTTVAVVYKISQKGDQYNFSTASTLCLSEFIKMVMSFGFLYSGRPASERSAKQTLHEILAASHGRFLFGSLALAFLYALNNNTVFIIFTLADPATINLVKSSAVFVTAFFLWFLFGRTIISIRWIVILLQVFGLIIMQWDPCKNIPVYPIHTYLLLVLSVTVTSVTSACNEYLIKNFKVSLHIQNFIMYAFGTLFNLMAFWLEPAFKGEGFGFFEGYQLSTFGVIACNSFIGLAVTAIYKYGDAIAKNMASSVTAVVLLFLSYLFFNLKLNLVVACGSAVVVISNYLWFTTGNLAPVKVGSPSLDKTSSTAIEMDPLSPARPTGGRKSSLKLMTEGFSSKNKMKFMLIGLCVFTLITTSYLLIHRQQPLMEMEAPRNGN